MTNTAALADRFALLKAEIDRLSDEMDKVRAEIKKTGLETLVGDNAIVTVSLYERSQFSSKAAKGFLTAEQIASCMTVQLCERISDAPKLPVTTI